MAQTFQKVKWLGPHMELAKETCHHTSISCYGPFSPHSAPLELNEAKEQTHICVRVHNNRIIKTNTFKEVFLNHPLKNAIISCMWMPLVRTDLSSFQQAFRKYCVSCRAGHVAVTGLTQGFLNVSPESTWIDLVGEPCALRLTLESSRILSQLFREQCTVRGMQVIEQGMLSLPKENHKIMTLTFIFSKLTSLSWPGR